ncbi:hypothetical protein ALC53_07899 [Atta colombica]|uniref:Uncharacterized protein n=1 Tax=Atta colombica TaxID=520822 RepID=A0A195BAE2_9HYME|nr:hypothetical protein ALC53_07899 [Atta colombica]
MSSFVLSSAVMSFTSEISKGRLLSSWAYKSNLHLEVAELFVSSSFSFSSLCHLHFPPQSTIHP